MASDNESPSHYRHPQAHIDNHVDEVDELTQTSSYQTLPTSSDTLDHDESTGSQSFKNRLPSVWRRGWKTLASMIGFYVCALLCAAGHLIFFYYLHERIIYDGDKIITLPMTKIQQSYVTNISLAFVTVFRAALVACIGVCYTQCLWQRLRRNLKVGVIEELFQIRANAYRLFKPTYIRYAPVLYWIAAISWLIPIAVIYPPGALIVGTRNGVVPERFNVSILTPEGQSLSFRNTTGAICSGGLWLIGWENGPNRDCAKIDPARQSMRYWTQVKPIDLLSQIVLVNSKVSTLDHPSRQNASYSLKFRGPMFQCIDSEITEILDFKDFKYLRIKQGLTVQETSNQVGTSLYEFSLRRVDMALEVRKSATEQAWGLTPCPLDTASRSVNLTGSGVTHTIALKRCEAASAEYFVDISFHNGIQKTSYTTGPSHLMKTSGEYGPEPSDLWPIKSYHEYFNVQAIISSFLVNFAYDYSPLWKIQTNTSAIAVPRNVSVFNTSSVMDVCLLEGVVFSEGSKGNPVILQLSDFNRDNRDSTIEISGITSSSLDISEMLLNQALANITISALSLNMWYDTVDGNYTQSFNIYRFEKRLNFFLPYGLSLLFALPVLYLGMSALYHNGVTAIDGGFSQILMTTRGRTGLENLAAQGCLGGEESIPEQLEKLEVRFGELIGTGNEVVNEASCKEKAPASYLTIRFENGDDDQVLAGGTGPASSVQALNETPSVSGSDAARKGDDQVVRRAGFGLLTETIPLKKGVQYG